MLYPSTASVTRQLDERKGDTTIQVDPGITPPRWRGPATLVGRATTISEPLTVWINAMEKAGMLDIGAHAMPDGQWVAVAGLPDGRTAIVTERVVPFHPNRLFAVILNGDMVVQRVVAGPEIKAGTHPVAMRMPDGKGWVGARYGATLGYQTSGGSLWQKGGEDAALLPEGAVHARSVTGGTADLVQLR